MFNVFKKSEKTVPTIIEQNKIALSRLLESTGVKEKTLDQMLKDLEKQGIIKS